MKAAKLEEQWQTLQYSYHLTTYLSQICIIVAILPFKYYMCTHMHLILTLGCTLLSPLIVAGVLINLLHALILQLLAVFEWDFQNFYLL